MPIIERSIQSRVKSLVAGECANHQNEAHGIRNFCWMREKSNNGACVFFSNSEGPRCRYFEEAVLPLDKDLRAFFSREVLKLEMQNVRKRMIRKKCERCSETFMAKSNAQRFCPKCQKPGYRDKARVWDRSKRKSALEPLNPRNQATLAF